MTHKTIRFPTGKCPSCGSKKVGKPKVKAKPQRRQPRNSDFGENSILGSFRGGHR